MTKGLMIAAPRSGSGKTTVTLGLLRALARRGRSVGACKCGPDYIDPAFHALATGRQSFNLDSWAMPPRMLDANFARSTENTEFLIAEGSMGLFDGVPLRGASGDGSSGFIAARYKLPVVLIMDASGQSQSAGAVALGFRQFDPQVKIAGVILGNIASDRHRVQAERGIERAGLPVFGALPRGAVPAIPERHLGLMQAEELPEANALIDALADAMEELLNIDAILASAGQLQRFSETAAAAPAKRIALARDAAFSFIYPHMLADWERAGAEILPFSPLANEAPSERADLCWLPGGYPELHAEKLSNNRAFIDGLRNFAQAKPVHGECGGYMALGETLTDASGTAWPMANLLPLSTSFAARKLHLGYRAVTLAADSPIGKKGARLRGHEFHYATVATQGECESLGTVSDANGTSLGSAGMRSRNVTGTFFHLVANDG